MSIIYGYEELEESLADFIEENDLDVITINSLLRSSIEFLQPELQTAAVVILNSGNIDKAKSIKALNVRVNIRFALEAIFAVMPMLTEKGIKLILLILKAIVKLADYMSVELSRDEAIVLFAIFRLQSADINRIQDYITENLSVDYGLLTHESLKKGLDNLERINSIKLIEGKYVLNEAIIIRNM